MLQKVAIAVASGAAALTFTVALAAAGFAPGTPVTATDTSATIVAPVAADPAPTVQVDTIYVAPPPPQQTITVHKVVQTSGGESENETGND